ncbi:MAG TPA: hypothetical protein VER33_25555 [Polyangiaceae bacterium]|nr:hypothetical protein [Polyangiaceae bacterium]
MLAYCQKKARWLVAVPGGLEITERRRTRCVPWADVRVILDLGRLGAGPGAKRYYIEFGDGAAFTFLGDTDAMDRLESLREGWRQQRTSA